jgi:hypothetical protein
MYLGRGLGLTDAHPSSESRRMSTADDSMMFGGEDKHRSALLFGPPDRTVREAVPSSRRSRPGILAALSAPRRFRQVSAVLRREILPVENELEIATGMSGVEEAVLSRLPARGCCCRRRVPRPPWIAGPLRLKELGDETRQTRYVLTCVVRTETVVVRMDTRVQGALKQSVTVRLHGRRCPKNEFSHHQSPGLGKSCVL